jgi:hypothetical protein
VRCDTPRAHALVRPRVRGRARGRCGAVLARSKPPERALVPDALDDPLVGARGNPSQASTKTGDPYPRERLAGDAVDEMRGDYATNRSTNRPLHQGGHGQGIY